MRKVNNSITYGLAALIGALARLILNGVWTWHSFFVGVSSIIIAVPLATLFTHWTGLREADPLVVHSLYTIFGVMSLQIVEKVDHIIRHTRIRAKLGAFEVDSDDDK